MAYLLDANVFIAAKNLHYGFEFCPAFWDWLIDAHAHGIVFSIDKVADEIEAGEDELAEWVDGLADSFFLRPDQQTLPALGRLSQWATSQAYTPAAVSTFLQIADYYLVAQALSGSHTVVTHETPSDSTRRVKIPNACFGVGVRYISPFDMLRREHARFILGAR